MSILSILLNISPALEKGKSLENAKTWSNVVTAKNALITVFGFALHLAKQGGYDIPITDEQLAELAGAVASIGAVTGQYFHHALNKDAGITKH